MMSSQILGLVFSRDRAMQLDGTLRSFFLHCQDPETARLFVIYKATNPQHIRQYNRLKETYQDQVQFVEETLFRLDVFSVLVSGRADMHFTPYQRLLLMLSPRIKLLARAYPIPKNALSHVLFLVDDNIFTASFNLQTAKNRLEAHPKALGFSLRLGMNTTQCYVNDSPQALPEFEPVEDDILLFDWTTAGNDFGYPLEVSSSIYRLDIIFRSIIKTPFKNPNLLEANLVPQVKHFRSRRPKLLCYRQSVTFCNPINKVQAIAPNNRAGSDPQLTSVALADLFDEGYFIDVQKYAGFSAPACHHEIDLIFRRE